MADQRPSASSSVLASSHNSRKRRRLSNERSERLHLPTVASSGSPPGILSVDLRGGDGSGNGGSGGSMYRRGGEIISSSSTYTKPLNHHNSNHFAPPRIPQPPSLPPSRPATPSRQPQQFTSQLPPHAITVLVSSIHNLVVDLAGNAASPSTSNSRSQSPSQIGPNQIPSMEALTTYLETIYALLLQLKPTPPAAAQPQREAQKSSSTPAEQQAAYTAHLSHLRHSLSTLELAHSTLRNEHTNLLSAISRSQTRASALDRKFLVCTEENESLSNERERLMGVVEGLEESLLEVRTERDDMRLEMRKSGAQWGAIVHNAGKLEQSAGKVEKALEKEVEGLKNDVQRLRVAVADGGGGCCAAVGEAGERERAELRRRVGELEHSLEDLRGEGEGIWELAERISKMGRGISERR